MQPLNLKPSHKLVKSYYETLGNRADDPEYIERLIGQVITVSLATMEIVNALPRLESAGVAAVTSENSGRE